MWLVVSLHKNYISTCALTANSLASEFTIMYVWIVGLRLYVMYIVDDVMLLLDFVLCAECTVP